jgi:hypothetical protein
MSNSSRSSSITAIFVRRAHSHLSCVGAWRAVCSQFNDEPSRSFIISQQSNNDADRTSDHKFNPLVLPELQTASDTRDELGLNAPDFGFSGGAVTTGQAPRGGQQGGTDPAGGAAQQYGTGTNRPAPHQSPR